MKTAISLLLILCFFIAASAFYIMQPSLDDVEPPKVMRVGVLPDVSADSLQQHYEPLLNYLSEETGLAFKLVLPKSYADLIWLFSERQVDLAYFGGYAFVRAQVFYGARPLVMRDIDTRFTSVFLVNSAHVTMDLADFKNKTIAFGSELSTSGHLMPRHFLLVEKQIVPEQFFSGIQYSGAHDKTAYLVRDGKVDLGVANTEIVTAMIDDGRLKENEIKVLWETPPYPDYVWAVHDDLDEDTRTRLLNAFLKLDMNDKQQNRVLARLGARFFLPARDNDFIRLKKVAASLELLQQTVQ